MDDTDRLFCDIGDHGIMVLSTCAGDRVTSRSMSVVVYGGRFYCQTNRDYLKYRQIAENPNVSLCFGKYSIEGVCEDAGRPYDVPGFIPAMERAYPDAVRRWSSLDCERVLMITPTYIRSWIYEDGIPYIEQWDIVHHSYRKERQ